MKLKPQYSLTDDVVSQLSSLAWWDCREMIKIWRGCRGNERKEWAARVRLAIKCCRQIEGYQLAKCYISTDRASLRGMNKKQRRWYVKWRAEKRAEKRKAANEN